jgi:hypothetical protein
MHLPLFFSTTQLPSSHKGVGATTASSPSAASMQPSCEQIDQDSLQCVARNVARNGQEINIYFYMLFCLNEHFKETRALLAGENVSTLQMGMKDTPDSRNYMA